MVGLGRMSVGKGWRRVEGPMGRWEGRRAWGGVGVRGVVGSYDGSARVPGDGRVWEPLGWRRGD